MGYTPSGRPTYSKACAAAFATTSPSGSARPMSSPARISSRRRMKRGLSPPDSIFPTHYNAPPAPRLDGGAAGVVVRAAVLVVQDPPPLDRLLGHLQRDVDHALHRRCGLD